MAAIEYNRPFQEEDVPFFFRIPKSLVLYEPRLGKTVVTCRAMMMDPRTRVILINCSKNALSVWIDHLKSWWKELRPDQPLEIRLIRGKSSNAAKQRMSLWQKPIPAGSGVVFLCTFETYYYDFPRIQALSIPDRFDTMILDEVHRKLRSRNTKSREVYKQTLKNPRIYRFHALSGTLAGKWGPADYWSLLNLIKPHEFPSYWSFADAFCIWYDNGFGKELVGTKNMDSFWHLMDRFARVRKRVDVMPQMPKVVRDLIWVEPTPEQAQIYAGLGESYFTTLPNGELIVAANSLERHIQKRQLLTCPKILDPSLGIGAAFEHLTETLEEARDDEDLYGYHVVIFSSFRKALPFFEAYLREHDFKDIGYLVGGTEPEDVVRITNEFRAKHGIILGTTQFAQAFSLVPARVCYSVGYDYDPNNNRQAEDRLVPQSGDFSISSNYYGITGTDDEELAIDTTLKGRIIHQTVTDARLHG